MNDKKATRKSVHSLNSKIDTKFYYIVRQKKREYRHIWHNCSLFTVDQVEYKNIHLIYCIVFHLIKKDNIQLCNIIVFATIPSNMYYLAHKAKYYF